LLIGEVDEVVVAKLPEATANPVTIDVVVDASIEKLSPAAGKTVFPAESFNVT
jgi:hypothetical protein